MSSAKLLGHLFSKIFNIGCACGCIPIDFAARRKLKPQKVASRASPAPTNTRILGVPWWGHVIQVVGVVLVPYAVQRLGVSSSVGLKQDTSDSPHKYYAACMCVGLCLVGSIHIIFRQLSKGDTPAASSAAVSNKRVLMGGNSDAPAAHLGVIERTGLTSAGDALLQNALVRCCC
jgi:hypothetical protein